MRLWETKSEIEVAEVRADLVGQVENAIGATLPEGSVPIRFAVTKSAIGRWQCELGVLSDFEHTDRRSSIPLITKFQRRSGLPSEFNVALIVPTGIGAEIGGHAGDAGPVATLLAASCDTLVTHPNVVNASDINELPQNALYVEGSVLSRLLMGTAGLQPVRSNRVLVLLDGQGEEFFLNAAVNSVSGARATYGLNCPAVVRLGSPLTMKAQYTSSGRAAGEIDGLSEVCRVLDEHKGRFDAVAISSIIKVPHEYHRAYFNCRGDMVNPWGGVEAMLTHALSSLFNVPTAHSPMFESRSVSDFDPGVVDPRMAAEAVSTTFLQCTLKGLSRSPRIVTDPEAMRHHSTLTASDISCLVIPDGCIGLPTLAALQQGITVVAVRENRNLMQNDLKALPWAPGQFHQVENYWEAAGVLTAIRAGIAPESVRRPFPDTQTSFLSYSDRIQLQPSKSNTEKGTTTDSQIEIRSHSDEPSS